MMTNELKELAKKYAKEQHERAKTHPKFEKMKSELGRKGAIELALNDLNEKQYKEPSYNTGKTEGVSYEHQRSGRNWHSNYFGLYYPKPYLWGTQG